MRSRSDRPQSGGMITSGSERRRSHSLPRRCNRAGRSGGGRPGRGSLHLWQQRRRSRGRRAGWSRAATGATSRSTPSSWGSSSPSPVALRLASSSSSCSPRPRICRPVRTTRCPAGSWQPSPARASHPISRHCSGSPTRTRATGLPLARGTKRACSTAEGAEDQRQRLRCQRAAGDRDRARRLARGALRLLGFKGGRPRGALHYVTTLSLSDRDDIPSPTTPRSSTPVSRPAVS
jgi:hypothetical protein